jgi:hypothetical protein
MRNRLIDEWIYTNLFGNTLPDGVVFDVSGVQETFYPKDVTHEEFLDLAEVPDYTSRLADDYSVLRYYRGRDDSEEFGKVLHNMWRKRSGYTEHFPPYQIGDYAYAAFVFGGGTFEIEEDW